MKAWSEAEIIAIDLQETANGGPESRDFDHQWYDSNNALHVTFINGTQPNS